jgi:hypothetical protein
MAPTAKVAAGKIQGFFMQLIVRTVTSNPGESRKLYPRASFLGGNLNAL